MFYMHMPPSCVFQPLQSFFNPLKPEWLEHLVTPTRSGCGVGLQNLGTRFLRWLLLWRETSQEHYSLKCCLFYSLLSCWVRTRVVAISLMKLTFPAACFLHVKNSCNWRNYLGQKLRVNTSISSVYFVNIFQLVQVHSFLQIAKVIRRLAKPPPYVFQESAPTQVDSFCKQGKKV